LDKNPGYSVTTAAAEKSEVDTYVAKLVDMVRDGLDDQKASDKLIQVRINMFLDDVGGRRRTTRIEAIVAEKDIPAPSERFECFHFERAFSLKAYYQSHGISKENLTDHVKQEISKAGPEYKLVLGKADFIAEENKDTGNPHNLEIFINVSSVESGIPPKLGHVKKTLPLPKKSRNSTRFGFSGFSRRSYRNFRRFTSYRRRVVRSSLFGFGHEILEQSGRQSYGPQR